jgi:hypothetical protein
MWRKINTSLALGLMVMVIIGATWGENPPRQNRESEPLLAPRLLVTPQWQPLTSNPDPVHGAPPARYNHSLAYSAATNTLYLFGGQGTTYFNDVWALNLGTLTWQRLFADASGTANTAYPVRRRTAIMSVDDTGQNLYVATGQQANGVNHNDAWRFNLSSKSWQKLCLQSPCSANVPDIRYGAAGANLGGDLIVSHGFDSGRYDDTWHFDISSGSWDKISPSNNLPLGRCLADGATVGNKFILHGGQSNPDPYRADTWIFNLNTEVWAEVATGGSEGTTKPAGRHHQSLVEYVDENGVLLFGGEGDNTTYLNDVWFLNLSSNSWQKLSPTGTAPSARRSHGAVWVEAVGNRPAGMLVSGGRGVGNTTLNDLWLLGFAAVSSGNPGALQFTSSNYSVAETELQATITITRSGGVSGTVTVHYNTSGGTAIVGQDYTPVSGTLTFNNGETGPKGFTVPLADDSQADGDKTVNLSLSNPTGGATLGQPGAASLTIVDSDAAGQLRFTLSSFNVNEAEGNAIINVTRSGGVSGTVMVDYATGGGTASPGSDYMPVSGTLTFNHGQAGSKSFTVPLLNDDKPEGPKTVSLSLKNPKGGVALGNPNTAILTILDDDEVQNDETFLYLPAILKRFTGTISEHDADLSLEDVIQD